MKYLYLLVPVLFSAYYPVILYLQQPWKSVIAFIICFVYLNINKYYSEIGQSISNKYNLGVNLMPNYWKWLLVEGVTFYALSLPQTNIFWLTLFTTILYILKMIELICWTILIFGLTTGKAYEIKEG